MTLVLDSSVLAELILGRAGAGEVARTLQRHGASLAAPELMDLEILSVLRRKLDRRELDEHRAGQAREDLAALPIQRCPHGVLIEGTWELRQNLTPYDAAYVALASLLEAPLYTGDLRLARATTAHTAVRVVPLERDRPTPSS